ncbi:MAG: thiolase family protein [Myxococcota bacterium]
MPYIIGLGSTAFTKHSNKSFHSLTEAAITAAIIDTGLGQLNQIGSIVVGNCAMHAWKQANIRGQVLMTPLQNQGLLNKGTPIVNVEAGCATGILAFHTALSHILSGMSELSLAFGIEKLTFPDDPKMLKSFPLFAGGIDQITPESWLEHYPECARSEGLEFQPDPRRLIFLDVHALQAMHALNEGWIDNKDIATVAAKNHCNGTNNELAQYRFDMTPEEVLSDRAIVPPLTRSMCAPLSDGACAIAICSDSLFKSLPPKTKRSAIQIRSCVLQGGQYRKLSEPDLVHHAAQKAFHQAQLKPSDIQMVELHDSTSFCEIKHLVSLGISTKETIQSEIRNGRFDEDGDCPVNLSGGLISKGHPLGATGLGMLYELCAQMKGTAGTHQTSRPIRFAAAHNGGGLVGLDEALCGVTLLENTNA